MHFLHRPTISFQRALIIYYNTHGSCKPNMSLHWLRSKIKLELPQVQSLIAGVQIGAGDAKLEWPQVQIGTDTVSLKLKLVLEKREKKQIRAQFLFNETVSSV
ncbi:hypothetical protein VNO78_34393 [Psophocarpus tetragonolobus]|uniref:Uncharacterized protein n=1 Tax=Psophocarpus tetragonolobus TaxID=3891 RepID=A0AAN9P050_PSOTE